MVVFTPVQAQASVSLSTVLTRLGAHIADYAARLPAAIASEHYRQWDYASQVILESDYGIMRLPGLAAWLGFRDVLTVNGKALPDRERRLASLFLHPSADAIQQARRIALESARFNLGPITRTINDPALVLELLDARNANRMRFVKAGEETIDRVPVWVLRFSDIGKPTVIRTSRGEDQPATGRVWVDPVTGHLHRAQVTVDRSAFAGNFTGTLDVRFLNDPTLGVLVPATMTEHYHSASALDSFGEATYSNYRLFGVETRIVDQ